MKLAIIVDDLTGGLDTGVKLAQQGVRTCLTVDSVPPDFDAEVAVILTYSRHLPVDEARERAHTAARSAREQGASFVYKKTDSVLRGHVGAEIGGVMTGFMADNTAFVPAFPALSRTTVKGVQYVCGQPVAQSHAARDLLNPVRHSRVRDIICEELVTDVYEVPREHLAIVDCTRDGVYVFDAETDDDMAAIAEVLHRQPFSAFAGCAGFAPQLVQLCGLEKTASAPPRLFPRTLFVCGSINETSLRQLRAARDKGLTVLPLPVQHKLSLFQTDSPEFGAFCETVMRALNNGDVCLCAALSQEDIDACDRQAAQRDIDSNTIAHRTARSLADVTCAVQQALQRVNLGVIGGDTAKAIVSAFCVAGITPHCELMPGVVLSSCNGKGGAFNLITRSGGFGGPHFYSELIEGIRTRL